MVRIRVDPSWSLAPDLGAGALDRLGGLLAIEVDGVDVTGGRAEGPVLAVLEGLLRGLARLQAGGRRAAVPLRDGELLLLLRRQGSQALVSLLELGPPSCQLVPELTLELSALVAAALEAAATLCGALEPAARGSPSASRRLRGLTRGVSAADRLAPPRPPGEGLRPLVAAPPEPGAIRCQVELDGGQEPLRLDEDERSDLAALLVPGRVTLSSSLGQRLALEGAPLLILRDLVAGLELAARAHRRGEASCRLRLRRTGRLGELELRLEPGRDRFTIPGLPTPGATLLDLVEAVHRAVAQFLALATSAAAAHAANAELQDLVERSVALPEALAEPSLGDLRHRAAPTPHQPGRTRSTGGPLAPGRLRRIALRRCFEEHVGLPVGPGLVSIGGAVVAIGQEALAGRAGRGHWRTEGADWAAAAGGQLLLRRANRLLAIAPATGQVSWERTVPDAFPTGAAAAPGLLVLAEPGAVTALDAASGATRWRLDLPGGSGLALAAFGPLLVAATGSGLVHAFDADGRVAWRLRGPGPALAAPLLADGALALLHAAGAAATLVAVEPETGQRVGEVPLDVVPVGPPVRFGAALALAGRSGGEGVLVRVDPRRGRAWEIGLPIGGPACLAAAGRGLLVADEAGGLARVGAGGDLDWSLPPDGAECGAVPVLVRRVVVAARAGLSLLDATSGRTLGHVPDLFPARLVADQALGVTALERDGAVTGLAAGGHLSLVW
jgi:outer membrane protein assembly factor BamB